MPQGHASELRSPGTEPSPQEQVLLGALSEMPGSTAEELAEAMTFAQEYLPHNERIPTPVTSRTTGQYLGLLRTRGLAVCDPPAGPLHNSRRKRIWTKSPEATL